VTAEGGQVRIAITADVRQEAETRREAARFVDPVVHQRTRDHDERRVSPPPGALLAREQQSQYLDRLAEAHVVGEAPAEAESPQKTRATQAFGLIGPERAHESLRGAGRLEAVEAPELAPQGGEGFVERGMFHGLEQCLDQADLSAAEAHVAVVLGVFVAEVGHRAPPLEPLLGKRPSVPSSSSTVSSLRWAARSKAGRRERLRQTSRRRADRAVDPGAHGH